MHDINNETEKYVNELLNECKYDFTYGCMK